MLTTQKIRLILKIIFFICILFSLPIVCGHKSQHNHEHSHEHEEPPSYKWSKEANEAYTKSESPSKSSSNPNIWMEAIGATFLISIAPYLILFIIPITNNKEHEPYLKVLLAFASGGLLGDAFLHLIPHALIAHTASKDNLDHSHTHQHGSHSHGSEENEEHAHGHDTVIGMSVLLGIIVFLMVEKFVRIFNDGHSHSHNVSVNGKEVKKNEKKNSKNSTSKKTSTKNSDMKVAGYLNLAADFTHNFTDGLAIGASFLAGRSIGIVTTFTIFLHEIPHEIGDFAILIQSGCSKKKAMCLQLITAFGALLGTWISLMAEGSGDAAVVWILPFTAGGFIYIATVSVIPELLENCNFWQSVIEVIALLCGVGLMLAISWLEEMGHHV